MHLNEHVIIDYCMIRFLSEILHNLNECFNDKTKYNNKTVKYASISHASVVIAKQLIEKLASRHL